MSKRCSVKLNSREQICLCFGNSTPFVIEGKVINPPYVVLTPQAKKTAKFLGIEETTGKYNMKKIFKAKTYFNPICCGTVAHENNRKIADFLNLCNAVILVHKFQTAKEIATFVLGGCKEESLNPSITLSEFIDMVISDEKGKEENPNSMNYQVYKTLKNSLKDWDKLNNRISELHQADFDELSAYLKNRTGKNGKKGANWERMMQCYRAIINKAIKQYNKVTGCNESNSVVLNKQNPNTQFKQRTGKTLVELYSEKNLTGAMTKEQVELFESIDPSKLDVKIKTWHNSKTSFYTLDTEKVCMCYDILSFMLYTGGTRPIDAIRMKYDNIDWEHNLIVYLPNKKNRFANDDNELKKHLTAVPLNINAKNIMAKYNPVNGYIFPCSCNIIDTGERPSIGKIEDYMNAVIKAIGAKIGLNFVPTCYTMRKTAITLNVDEISARAKVIAMQEAAKLAGTSLFQVQDTYYKNVNK